jgi:hypothetical protein
MPVPAGPAAGTIDTPEARTMAAPSADDLYTARCEFQRQLDRAFPRGAVCAVLEVESGRPRVAGEVVAAGRIFCSDARPSPNGEGWEYEILVDPRGSTDEAAETQSHWVIGLRSHPTNRGLWEAPIRSNGRERMVRLATDAAPAAMPTPAMREAATAAHERRLFPKGIE